MVLYIDWLGSSKRHERDANNDHWVSRLLCSSNDVAVADATGESSFELAVVLRAWCRDLGLEATHSHAFFCDSRNEPQPPIDTPIMNMLAWPSHSEPSLRRLQRDSIHSRNSLSHCVLDCAAAKSISESEGELCCERARKRTEPQVS